MARFVNNISMKCPVGMENAICGLIIGAKGKNVLALKNEFEDPTLQLKCELMDDVENVTFITYSTNNTFISNRLDKMVMNKLVYAIRKAQTANAEVGGEVELSIHNGTSKQIIKYANGVVSSDTTIPLGVSFDCYDSEFPAL